MSRQFTLPDLGEGVQEGQVLRLLVAEGETVAEDQLIMEVETDKAAVEIPSPFAGMIARWHVSEQQVVNVGDVMVTFDDGDGAAAPPTPATAAVEAAPPASAPAAARPARAGRATPASPAVRKLARALGVDLATVAGSGPGGRVLRRDVEAAASGAAPATPAPPAPAAAPPTPTPAPASVTPVPPGADRRVPLSATRKAIAAVMTRSASTIPHVTDCDDADVTDLDRLRRGHVTAAADGTERRIGLFSFLVRAVARALRAHPLFNSSYDESAGEIVHHHAVNIAVGVHTDRGLIAPVLHDADTLSIPEIDRRLAELADHARRGALGLDEARGATYTLSNAGAIGGSRYSTPIITPPQVAVLAIGRSRPMPWVVDGAVVPRLVMPLSHSMDHRVIDGAEEIAFMRHLIGDLEHPGRLLL
jgi:pyruvate dehydrogenase E2 component (dihydrolipoamide acetyltransferase)